MKNKAKVVSIILFLSAFIMLVSFGEQKTEWKGTIEELNGITFIKNPENPISNNAGREMKLTEVLRITDVGDEYYFENPQDIKVAPDGSIFVNEKAQFLQFSKDGKFLHNYFKKGQGPEEVTGIRHYWLSSKDIFLQNDAPPKILRFRFDGRYIEETAIRQRLYFPKFLLYHNERFYFIQPELANFEGMSSIVNVKQKLISVSHDGRDMSELFSFSTREYWVRMSWGGRGIIHIDELKAVPFQNKFLVVSHTQEYLLKIYDVEANQIIKMFNREYSRARLTKEFELEKTSGLSDKGKPIKVPGLDYHDDVREIFLNNNQIWIMTSTVDKDKGTQFDAFDFNGKYVDCFYIKLPDKFRSKIYGKWHMAVEDDFLYTIEQDSEGAYSLVKYKIKDAV